MATSNVLTIKGRDDSYEISVEENPAGYSEGTFGYIIRPGSDRDSCWANGGYASRTRAIDAAREHVDRIEA